MVAGHRLADFSRWGVLFLAIFLAFHWQEVATPTFNLDDWAVFDTPIWQVHLNRPGWDVMYALLFQYGFSPFIGWLIGGCSIFLLACSTVFFAPRLTPPWVFLLALLIAAHPYVLDLFNFSFAIGLYLLPAPISVAAAVLMGHVSRWRLPAWIAGILLFTGAMSLYQPMGYYGVAVLGLQGLAEALGLRRFARLAWLRVLLGSLIGGILYYLLSSHLATYIASQNGLEDSSRKGLATLPLAFSKLTAGSIYQEVYHVNLPLIPPVQLIPAVIFLLMVLIGSAWIVRQEPGLFPLARRLGLLWLSAGLLTLLPFLLFYVLRTNVPPRSLALANFGISSFLVIVLATISRGWGQWPQSRHRIGTLFLYSLVFCLAIGYILPQGMFASRIWGITQVLERRDMAFAQLIASEARLKAGSQGLPTSSFGIYGLTDQLELFPHWVGKPTPFTTTWGSVGQSSFSAPWGIEGLFATLMNIQIETIAPEDGARIPPCTAYPKSGSMVVADGKLIVCLQPNVGSEP